MRGTGLIRKKRIEMTGGSKSWDPLQSYEELFIKHCANHANFIEPEYYIKDEEPIPYSIGKTTHICSACLEFFNIIGSKWKKKLVVPCPARFCLEVWRRIVTMR